MTPAGPLAPKILVVDDDVAIVGVLRRALTAGGFQVVSTDNGSEALMLVRESKPDLVLVDARMPGLDGHTCCRVLKKEASTRNIPVIIMSGALVGEEHVVSGFAGGADDYVLKPFSLPVLEARILAVLRRYEVARTSEEKLRRCGIELDPDARSVKVQGRVVSLTRKEFDLLAVLLSRPNKVLNINYLLETVWGYDPADYNDPGTVEVHVCHLRKKLGPKAAKRIVNVTGLGYKFEE
ncbi:MAG: response regulator transcription factor [Elusimicrobia bacterium]|nr:response regulator transcription factor [Elusimicrobiota bacterium]